jgi:hypothetical protein
VEAIIGLVGVALGATLAPFVDWVRQRGARRDARRRELLDLVAALVSTSGDQVVAESETPHVDTPWAMWVASHANTPRWRLALLAPPGVADAGEAFAQASETLGKAIAAAGTWDDDRVAVPYVDWKRAERSLIDATRAYLDPL